MKLAKDYLKTLRRVPDDVILDVAGRDIDLELPSTCVCGWVVRAALAQLRGTTPEAVDMENIGAMYDAEYRDTLTGVYGGTVDEWNDVYYGVSSCSDDPDSLAHIERAFLHRVLEASQGRRLPFRA
jgi:hypothetical protein